MFASRRYWYVPVKTPAIRLCARTHKHASTHARAHTRTHTHTLSRTQTGVRQMHAQDPNPGRVQPQSRKILHRIRARKVFYSKRALYLSQRLQPLRHSVAPRQLSRYFFFLFFLFFCSSTLIVSAHSVFRNASRVVRLLRLRLFFNLFFSL